MCYCKKYNNILFGPARPARSARPTRPTRPTRPWAHGPMALIFSFKGPLTGTSRGWVYWYFISMYAGPLGLDTCAVRNAWVARAAARAAVVPEWECAVASCCVDHFIWPDGRLGVHRRGSRCMA